MNLALI